MQQLSQHLWVHAGHINTGVLCADGRALVIDIGNGHVTGELGAIGVTAIDTLLFTHHHRDQACGAAAVNGARVIVPEAERQWFEGVDAFWHDPAYRWHLYNQHPHHLMLTEPLHVDGTLADGETLTWGPARITALATPGHTDGSLTYLVEVDGLRVAFTGDLIYDAGQLWECYSLQKGNATVTDYHGFLGARDELAFSVQRVRAADPTLLVPAHGHLMHQPAAAIALLLARLLACIEQYEAITALRYYFPALVPIPYAPLTGEESDPPDWLHHDGTTWVLVSESGATLVMDCGSEAVVANLRRMLATGEISAVEGLWITHYHDDHVDGIPAFQAAFDCPCIADAAVAQIIADPLAWRMPCTSPAVARVDRVTQDGEQWQWHEFTLTAYHFPGQSLYHGGLLVEGRGRRLFFAGDSFTPTGIDDYCAQNRNFLGAGVGYDRCLALLQQRQPEGIINPHVNTVFTFSLADYALMRSNLALREETFGALFPWDHANYGMDEWWLRCHPYEQHAAPGDTVRLSVMMTNHSIGSHHAACHPALPAGWKSDTAAGVIPAKREAALPLTIKVPSDAAIGRYIVPVSLTYDGVQLPQITEGIIEVR